MKNIHKKIFFVFVLFWALGSCTHDPIDGSTDLDIQLKKNIKSISPTGNVAYYILPDRNDFEHLPQDPNNPLTKVKVELGRMLFFETGMALDANHPSSIGTYSCASCHIPSAGYLPGISQGMADGAIGFGLNGEGRSISPIYQEDQVDVQGNRPLSVLNVGYVTNTSWNGQFGGNNVNIGTEHLWDLEHSTEVNHLGYHGLECQNIEGLDVHRMVMNRDVADSLGYLTMFDQAFSNWDAEERYGKTTTALAISAYLRTLTTNEAPFQKWLEGDKKALTESQKNGALLFFGDAQCYFCHKSPALQSNEFHALGTNGIYQLPNPIATNADDNRNLGRGGFTRDAIDNYKFQVPQLYNLKNAGFYFHGSSKRSLKEVVQYKSAAKPENPDIPTYLLSNRFEAVNLSDQDIDHLVDFLENGLFDPNIDRHVPEAVLSGNCFPNNDPLSRIHLNCD